MPSKVATTPVTIDPSAGLKPTSSGVWWALIMDGLRTRLFIREHRRAPFLESVDALASGSGGVAVEPREMGRRHGSPEQAERQLFERIAQDLERYAKADAFDHLIVVAAPTALAALRGVLGLHAIKRLRVSAAKDLSGLSPALIVRRLQTGEI